MSTNKNKIRQIRYENGMKVNLFLLCWNEKVIIADTIQHYRSKFSDIDITILDNESTDNSRKIAESLDCKVEIWTTDNKINEHKLRHVKNNCWKKVQNEWVIVCDMDEWLEIDEEQLKKEDKNGVTIIKTQGYNIVTDCQTEDYSGVNLSEAFNGYRFDRLSKNICFKAGSIVDINFHIGAHFCDPKGDVKFSDTVYILRHLNFISLSYRLKREVVLFSRSIDMRKERYDVHYLDNEDGIREKFNNRMKESSNIIELHKTIHKKNIYV